MIKRTSKVYIYIYFLMTFFDLFEKNKNPKNNSIYFLRKETRKAKIIFVFNIHRNEIVGQNTQQWYS